jgi:hypothetical protein
MALVTAEDVIAYVGVKNPGDFETAWAGKCADAVESGIYIRLNGALITDPPPSELHLAATMAAGEAYKRREVPFGVTGYNDTEGAIRLARDYLEQVRPQIDRYGNGPGIG